MNALAILVLWFLSLAQTYGLNEGQGDAAGRHRLPGRVVRPDVSRQPRSLLLEQPASHRDD
jgi:hypothetical protein